MTIGEVVMQWGPWAAILALAGWAVWQGFTLHALRRELRQMAQRMGAARDSAPPSASALQHVGLVRFNPFSDTGGDLSFALALADADGRGVVLCNLHGRGESRLYAKPLQAWGSPYPLSDEEVQAVTLARGEGADVH